MKKKGEKDPMNEEKTPLERKDTPRLLMLVYKPSVLRGSLGSGEDRGEKGWSGSVYRKQYQKDEDNIPTNRGEYQRKRGGVYERMHVPGPDSWIER